MLRMLFTSFAILAQDEFLFHLQFIFIGYIILTLALFANKSNQNPLFFFSHPSSFQSSGQVDAYYNMQFGLP